MELHDQPTIAGPGRRRTPRPAALALLTLAVAPTCGPPDPPPHVVLLLVDTLRADYLGYHGFAGEISPGLDRLAGESVVYERCFAQSPWTKPSMATLFTSLYPQVHRLTNHEGRYWGSGTPALETGVLAAQAETLAERLRAAGYATGGFIANPWMRSDYGFAQGFDHYDESGSVRWDRADSLIERARSWIDGLPPRRPFFLYLHFMDVHAPYQAPREDFDRLVDSPSLGRARTLEASELPDEGWHNLELRPPWATDELRRELRYWRARYASGVRALDRRLERLIRDLRDRGLLDRSIVVLTSDHGEELFEHGDWSHGRTLFDHQLHVPLSIRLPGARGAGTRVGSIVELIDLMPTLLALTGAEPAPGQQGRNVSPGAEPDEQRASFATATQWSPGLHSIRTIRHKLLWDSESRELQLFDLESDPGERHDASSANRALAAELQTRLGLHLAESIAGGTLDPGRAAIPPAVRERLEALGYVD